MHICYNALLVISQTRSSAYMFQIHSRCVPEKTPYASAGNITPSLTLYPHSSASSLPVPPDWCYLNNTQKQSPKSSQSRELVDTTSFLLQSRPHTILESMLGWLGPQCVVGSPAGFFSTLIFHTLYVFTCKNVKYIYIFSRKLPGHFSPASLGVVYLKPKQLELQDSKFRWLPPEQVNPHQHNCYD